mmetsp:Transcript_8931/g.18691  ORF Transcript_8931/g.18691 Transcript_8931/m.18691 type:complete len:191 (+) Transcript_8931:114-686(+)
MSALATNDHDGSSIIHPLINPSVKEEEIKREHLCFGCCCNSRESVIAVQGFLGILWNIAMLIGYLTESYKNWTADPQLRLELEDAYQKIMYITTVGIAVAIIVIIGAKRYKVLLVSLGALYTIIQYTLEPIFLIPVISDHVRYPYFYYVWPIVVGILVLYPHIVFIYEMNTGVLANPNVDPRVDDDNVFL